MLAVRDATKSYRQGEAEVKALAGVTLDVAAGEFVAIVGPSGSGKSTLLHLMGGLDAPTSGDVLIDGASIARMSDDEVTIFRRRAIGFVFQFFNLLPTLSAEENVALPLLLDGMRPRDIRDRVAAALEAVGLAHRRGHRPDEMSGGEMQRAAIARAIVVEPEVVFADEPTGNLDSGTGAQVLDLLGELNRAGTTLVLVTHDAAVASRAHRRMHLTDGRFDA